MGSVATAATRRWHPEDTIRYKSQIPSGVVVRSWNDSGNNLPSPDPDDPPPLAEGMVEIDFPCTPGPLQTVSGDELALADRRFVVGDLAQHLVLGDIGVIKSVTTKVLVVGVLKYEGLNAWVDATSLESARQLTEGDCVATDHWIGRIDEIFQEVLVEDTTTKSAFYICGKDVEECGPGGAANHIGQDQVIPGRFVAESDSESAPHFERVLDAREIAIAVNWFALNPKLPIDQQGVERPKRIWTEYDSLTLVSQDSRDFFQVGDKVKPRIGTEVYDKLSSVDQYFMVLDRQSRVDVMWMDGTITRDMPTCSFDFGQNFDPEHECSPGQVALWTADGEQKVVVVNKMDPKNRIAEVRCWGTHECNQVSVLELDPIGKPEAPYGVRWGQEVLICNGPTGVTFPVVPQIGEPQTTPSAADLSLQLKIEGSAWSQSVPRKPFSQVQQGKKLDDFDWAGVVVDLNVDGTITVRLPSDRLITVPHENVYVLHDGAIDLTFDELGDFGEDMDYTFPPTTDAAWSMDVDETVALEGVNHTSAPSVLVLDAVVEPPVAKPQDHAEIVVEETSQPPRGELEAQSSDSTQSGATSSEVAPEIALSRDSPWIAFKVLDEAPTSHHYFNETDTSATRAYTTRLTNEYKALINGLPDNIIVRTYEHRCDLMRACIIGAADTPYEDACFVFDLVGDFPYTSHISIRNTMLTKFPRTPPRVFFHSWTNGAGRVQPNLYEDGNVCLSILGTWTGKSTENWIGDKCSILQVLVSISALCLVNDPYWNEPMHESQLGTEHGRLAAKLYAERAFVLTRGFVKHVLANEIPSLNEELKWIYLKGGKLASIIARARRLIQDSERGESIDDDVMMEGEERGHKRSTLTAGGIIPLQRVVTALERVAKQHKTLM